MMHHLRIEVTIPRHIRSFADIFAQNVVYLSINKSHIERQMGLIIDCVHVHMYIYIRQWDRSIYIQIRTHRSRFVLVELHFRHFHL